MELTRILLTIESKIKVSIYRRGCYSCLLDSSSNMSSASGRLPTPDVCLGLRLRRSGWRVSMKPTAIPADKRSLTPFRSSMTLWHSEAQLFAGYREDDLYRISLFEWKVKARGVGVRENGKLKRFSAGCVARMSFALNYDSKRRREKVKERKKIGGSLLANAGGTPQRRLSRRRRSNGDF